MILIEVREVSRVSENLKVNSSKDIYEYCIKRPIEMNTLSQENCYCFCLDIKNNVKSIELISRGSLNTSIVHPREVLKAAVLTNAASIILVHNHPSGDPDPSLDDIQITDRIKQACKIMGINILDHIIVGQNQYFSFKQKDML